MPFPTFTSTSRYETIPSSRLSSICYLASYRIPCWQEPYHSSSIFVQQQLLALLLNQLATKISWLLNMRKYYNYIQVITNYTYILSTSVSAGYHFSIVFDADEIGFTISCKSLKLEEIESRCWCSKNSSGMVQSISQVYIGTRIGNSSRQWNVVEPVCIKDDFCGLIYK